jgi:AAA family ATP:ADP antiporter
MPAIEPARSSGFDRGGRKLLSLLGVDVRAGEGTAALLLFMFFFLVITFQYVSKSVRQSWFMDELGATMLPIAYLLLAACAIPVILLYNRAVDRYPRHHVIAATCGIVALSVVLFWWLMGFEAQWIPISFYIWISIAYVLIVSQFWAYSNHALDPRQGKRLFGFIGAGGLAGGITGASVASFATGLVDTRFSLLVSAAILLLAIAIIYIIHAILGPEMAPRDRGKSADKLEAARGGLQVIRGSRHLQLIAALMFLTVVVANIVDLQFNWAMEQAVPNAEGGARLDALTAGYGNFYVLMGVSALIFQLLFTARIHRYLGIGVAMRILPFTMALGTTGLFIAATAVPAVLLGVCLILKVGENGLRYSLDQATRELLFFPVPSADRLKAKAYIDVFVQRSGKAGAALLLLPVTFAILTPVQAGWISMVLIVLWLGVTVALRREFVRSFRDGLRERTVDVAVPVDLSDVTSLELMVQSLGSPDPRQVLRGLEMLAYHKKLNLVPPLLLYHDNSEVKIETLRFLAECGRSDATPIIERVLGDDDPDVRAAAIHALAVLSHEDVRTIMAPRLFDLDPRVRSAAVVSIINHGDGDATDRAAQVLEQMAADTDPGVREQAATALGGVDEPRFNDTLMRLLYDGDNAVVRAATSAVRSRAERGKPSPLFVPTLISLMRDRRLKHEAREALVAYGEEVIPALAHFMGDPQETMWVRRALPKTIARIGGRAAQVALLDNLGVTDLFLRRKVIEALGWLHSAEPSLRVPTDRIAEEIHQEARRYFLGLTDLVSVSGNGELAFESPSVHWQRVSPTFVQLLLEDGMRQNLVSIFGMLELAYAARDIRAAYQGLMSGDKALRSHALEYLDNSLTGEIHRAVFSVISEDTLENKLRTAQSMYQLAVQPSEDVLRRLVLASSTLDEGAHWLGTAAIHAIYEGRVEELYPQVIAASRRDDESLVEETAQWVHQKLGLAPA